MHCSNFEIDGKRMDEGEILVTIAALVMEGRIPLKSSTDTSASNSTKNCGFYEGPHTKNLSKQHSCNSADPLCRNFEKVRSEVSTLCKNKIPLSIEVVLTSGCACAIQNEQSLNNGECDQLDYNDLDILLEQWLIAITYRRIHDKTHINLSQLINAIRSRLHFSQISAWLNTSEHSSKLSKENIKYRLSVPGETLQMRNFKNSAIKHDFPTTDLGNGFTVQTTLLSLPRLTDLPVIKCKKCEPVLSLPFEKIKIASNGTLFNDKNIVDDRMHTSCTIKGKHRCEDYDEFDCELKSDPKAAKFKRVCQSNTSDDSTNKPSTSKFVNFPLSCEYSTYSCEDSIRFDTVDSKKSLFNNKINEKFQDGVRIGNNFVDNTVNENLSEIDLDKSELSKADILLNAILRSSHLKDKKGKETFTRINTECCDKEKNVNCDFKCVQKFGRNCPNLCANAMMDESDINISFCDTMSASGDIFSIKKKSNHNIYIDKHCDTPIPKLKHKQSSEISNTDTSPFHLLKLKARRRITCSEGEEEDQTSNKRNFSECFKSLEQNNMYSEKDLNKNEHIDNAINAAEVPSALEQAKFRKSLGNATSMVFHSRTRLPLTSSPAPIRRGKSCFDFDSSINTVSSIGSAFSSTSDDESESDGSAISPCSPDFCTPPSQEPAPAKRKHTNNLLGTFEESVLNGRLEPVSTVHGFTAELGASGSFVPKHIKYPVTVFFYNLGDNEKVSSPYLGHINIGKKGYQVPKSGTIQVTLFNPLGTVVKMFVIMYDLSDMPPNSQTFIRQRTLYMPIHGESSKWNPKWLRYLIHLRFMSSKSGRIYLHSDIRMIIFRKFDLDTATAHGVDKSYELRSFTDTPINPQFSLRKKV